ncbi:hypothetical protein [Thiolinea disciformis]|uniref:hypothetical protein n=1 Tax=Thiolinea disciformis TaxID=125614 RepID=UPI0003787F95|nr:hypothetical protein [Thiolinea disciformis]
MHGKAGNSLGRNLTSDSAKALTEKKIDWVRSAEFHENNQYYTSQGKKLYYTFSQGHEVEDIQEYSNIKHYFAHTTEPNAQITLKRFNSEK